MCQRLFRSISNATYYPAGVEAFTLLLDHSVDTPTIGVHGAHGGPSVGAAPRGKASCLPSPPVAPSPLSPDSELAQGGRLSVCGVQRRAVRSHALRLLPLRPLHHLAQRDRHQDGPRRVPPEVCAALLPVSRAPRPPSRSRRSTLLEAASLGLDDSAPGGSSLRNEGAVVILDIEYRNFQSWFGLSDGVTYRYKPSKLDASPYKEVGIAAQNATQRVWRDRHGVKIVALQTGRLGAVDMTTLLVQLTTSCEQPAPAPFGPQNQATHTTPCRHSLVPSLRRLTLLAGATAIVDALALYTMPERKYYRKAKIQVTADFGDLRAQRAAASEALLS